MQPASAQDLNISESAVTSFHVQAKQTAAPPSPKHLLSSEKCTPPPTQVRDSSPEQSTCRSYDPLNSVTESSFVGSYASFPSAMTTRTLVTETDSEMLHTGASAVPHSESEVHVPNLYIFYQSNMDEDLQMDGPSPSMSFTLDPSTWPEQENGGNQKRPMNRS